MSNAPPSWIVRVVNGVFTAMLVIFLVGTPFFLAAMIFVPGDADWHVEVNVPRAGLSSLPENARLADTVPVEVDLNEPTAMQRFGLALGYALPSALLIFLLVKIRKILGTVRHGDPFVSENIRRLRWIAIALIVGDVILRLVPQFINEAVAEGAGVRSFSTDLSVPGLLSFVGLGVLVLAHVFAHGVRLREDVEGTV